MANRKKQPGNKRQSKKSFKKNQKRMNENKEVLRKLGV